MRFIHSPRHSQQRPILLIAALLLLLTALISFLRQSPSTILVVETAESASLQGSEYWSLLIGAESSYNQATRSLLTSDGGLLLVGISKSFGAGNDDGWLLKLDQTGQIQWQKTYGGSHYEYLQSPIETADGNILVVGATGSFNGTGNPDGWVVKLNQNGAIIWQKTYDSTGNNAVTSIAQLNDGGYMLSGATDPDDDNRYNAWIARLDATGNIVWEKAFGGASSNSLGTLNQTSDGGFIAVGGYVATAGLNGPARIVKLNSNGTINWEYKYNNQAVLGGIYELSDGSFIASGTIKSTARDNDIYIVKIASNGQVIWQKSYGTTEYETGGSIQVINDNELMVAGTIDEDFWLMKLDGAGNIIWQKSYGNDDNFEAGGTLQRAANGDLYIVGYSQHSNVGKTFIVKVDSNGNADNCSIVGSANGNVVNLTEPAVSSSPTNQAVSSTVASTTAVMQDSAATSSFVCGGPPTFTINGRVIGNNGLALPGTEIGYQPGESVTTDGDGYYTITNLLPGNYTLVPTLPGYAFSPGNHTVSVPPDQTSLDFVGTPIVYNSFDFLPALFK